MKLLWLPKDCETTRHRHPNQTRRGLRADIDEDVGVLITTEDLAPSRLHTAVEYIEQAYPTLDGVTEFVSDWA